MKRRSLLYMVLVMMIAGTALGQVPRMLNYQGIVRNSAGQPLVNQAIGLKITIQDGMATVLFQETHAVTTNAYGLYNVIIGAGTPLTGAMASVNFLLGERYILVEVDPAGGTSYVAAGAPTRLMAVPYAIAAAEMQATSSGGGGLVGNTPSGLYWGMYENGVERGYLGSYSGKNEDVDFGTSVGNTLGNLHLTLRGEPRLTIDSIGLVGIGTRSPQSTLTVRSLANDIINIGYQNGWTAIGMANSSNGPYNVIGNGGTYMSFLYSPTPTPYITASLSKMLMDGGTNTFRPTNDNVMSLGANGSRWKAV